MKELILLLGVIVIISIIPSSMAIQQPTASAPTKSGGNRERQISFWDAWRFLVGDWEALGGGEPGSGSGSFSFQFDLQEKILVRRNHTVYPAAGKLPQIVHDDLMIIYPTIGQKGTAAIYFDNEGHVIHYTAQFSVDQKTLTLLSDPSPSAPRFRLTYQNVSPKTLEIKFEIAPPANSNAFSTYVSGKANRKSIK